ncbi:hypothetical protein A3J20_05410 [Candidatus Gottesmanbacteria bacterium RIFCSPLOWO2_02_FULL_42_29]|uniref:ParB/Sulfiredoxin domain-containing protein n=2 Tax=Candidatus Gottesmaniibacteriota TaxID=1752720 RepID=A0A1F6BJ18_9BACT|nr:MAG: hypothetical protein UV09_C0029G0005 [Candidatus Gottesmanbacteria bacterium GW2011_GWA2_42_18]KKS74404.1 MAG: hypothetical protein UV46_C0044G0004 [Candidatus Gottesmanbacteria bacterium GW2011_GWC2_42_8]OGG11140.1 MAG: hypothetical protein A2781_05130 [Candidatus Gottesmanbacteria bacterium RIFCSPHIGHO2_01_FULL_42_27]OGG33592.1 MAG: hypothetical protein A3G68_06160 [Candidatus Gottesmanbacteria bacterium RIFCSPLOWO2_12_FULL_42_10]OGG36914.1 MAG: hypothetical protein A2968_01920 [Candi
MKTDIFHLQIIPLKDILPHEYFDESRSLTLAKRLKKDNFLSNPIIVAPLGNHTYAQLDGMNRLSTFKKLGFNSILCQIVDYQDMDNVELSSWLHFINVNSHQFLKHLGKIKDLIVNKGIIDDVRNRYIQSEGFDKICTFVTEDFEVYLVTFGGSLLDKVKVLNEIVGFYNKDIVRSVLPQSSTKEAIKNLFKEHLKHRQMVSFPTFTRHQIMKIVKQHGFFPPGITRHVIKRRCLNVNLPFSVFNKNDSIGTQNRNLEQFLRQRKFRLYEEPTIYFE